jgi:hypothetical protein
MYRRLDTLRETNGRFRVNATLPIPFDGFGTLEVDLLCADARLAIELDGGQHLADPTAYRRDRRKDLRLRVLPYGAEHAFRRFDLPAHHADPFDRQIIAQALVENVPVVTPDEAFNLYEGLKVVW